MKIDLNKLRANLASSAAATPTTPAPAETAKLPEQLPAPVTTQANSALDMAKNISNALARKLPDPDPTLSDEENYLRQIEASALFDKIDELQTALLSSHPTMPILLREIHSTLKKQPDNVTLVSDEQINVIVSGLAKYANVSLAVKTATKKPSAKSLAKISLEDLGL